MLDENYEKYNWSLITINFHPTDTDAFEYFLNTTYKPYVKQFPIYINALEYPNTLYQHLHTVIARPKTLDNAKLRQKLSGKRFLKDLKLYNTKDINALDVKSLDTFADVCQSIGYCNKQRTTILFHSDIPQTDIDICYKAWLYSSKDVIHKVKHVLEYKNVSKGDLLLYLYDYHIEHPEIPLCMLESHLIANTKLSLAQIPLSILRAVRIELKLKLKLKSTHLFDYIENITHNEILPLDNTEYMELPKYQLIEEINKLRAQNEELKNAVKSLKKK